MIIVITQNVVSVFNKNSSISFMCKILIEYKIYSNQCISWEFVSHMEDFLKIFGQCYFIQCISVHLRVTSLKLSEIIISVRLSLQYD